jgi:hypothetical protein
MQVAGCSCIGHGNESISPHTRTLYSAGASTRERRHSDRERERKRERERERKERPRCCPFGLYTFSGSRVSPFVYRSVGPTFSSPPFRLSSCSPAESSRTRNSQPAVRTLNARPCRTHAFAHPDADNAGGGGGGGGRGTSRCLPIVVPLVVFSDPGQVRSHGQDLSSRS